MGDEAAPAKEPPTNSQPAHAPAGDQDLSALIARAAEALIDMQEEDGAWPYEGVYRVQGQIPVGYRVGGTSLVAGALLYVPDDFDGRRNEAVRRGLAFVLQHLGHRLMAPSREDRYDVRIWGHACALEFLCRVDALGIAADRREDVQAWIKALSRTIADEEIDGGGWNYATRRHAASFVTAPVLQALLWARSRGVDVSEDVLNRGAAFLEAARVGEQAVRYSGRSQSDERSSNRATAPGSCARLALCETTLRLFQKSTTERVLSAVEMFHRHWDELEKRRAQNGTHKPPYGIAPYYFYFGHRYVAQAIQLLPAGVRDHEYRRLLAKLDRTRTEDGTFNDRVFPRSSNYGTAMALICMLGEDVPLPPASPASPEKQALPNNRETSGAHGEGVRGD